MKQYLVKVKAPLLGKFNLAYFGGEEIIISEANVNELVNGGFVEVITDITPHEIENTTEPKTVETATKKTQTKKK